MLLVAKLFHANRSHLISAIEILFKEIGLAEIDITEIAICINRYYKLYHTII